MENVDCCARCAMYSDDCHTKWCFLLARKLGIERVCVDNITEECHVKPYNKCDHFISNEVAMSTAEMLDYCDSAGTEMKDIINRIFSFVSENDMTFSSEKNFGWVTSVTKKGHRIAWMEFRGTDIVDCLHEMYKTILEDDV